MKMMLLDIAFAHASDCVDAAGDALDQLPEPVQTVLVVQAVHGIIDNGGLAYFYESDFPGQPPYALFASAFRRIGAHSVAACIEKSAAMFPFPEPHRHEAKRQQWLDGVKCDDAHAFSRLSRLACGDALVMPKLAEYVERHSDAFTAEASA